LGQASAALCNFKIEVKFSRLMRPAIISTGNSMISREFGDEFAREWIEAWNDHDLDRVLSHYSEDFTMSSPYIAQFFGISAGTLTGKAEIHAYWADVLAKLPSLKFELVQVLVGAASLIVYYRGVRGMAAEIFFFGEDLLVHRAAAHYE
jgi:hypothetical protein